MQIQEAFAYCEAQVQARDRDRFLATLFAPPRHRAALHALYAFNLEIGRVRDVAHGPAGEIRLAWWNDVLGGEGRGEVASNPVAAALLATIAQYRLERGRLEALIAAHRFDLYDEPMSSLADLESYADATKKNVIASAMQILIGRASPELDAISHHLANAQAVVGLLAAFPVHARRGQLYIPLEILERHGSGAHELRSPGASAALRASLAELRAIARHHLHRARGLVCSVPEHALPALLPAALTGPTLARMERNDYDPFEPPRLAPWRAQWLLWRAARRPERIFAL